MENLRYLLHQYDPRESLYLGHRYTKESLPNGYMAGKLSMHSIGSCSQNILILRWRIHFIQKSFKNFHRETSLQESKLPKDKQRWHRRLRDRWSPIKQSRATDAHFFSSEGYCLKEHAVFVDCRDEKKQKRFFPVGISAHLSDRKIASWYFEQLYYSTAHGSLKCCSDTFTQMHYIHPHELHFLSYLIYHVHPFGVRKNLTENLPRRKLLREIQAESNAKSINRKANELKRKQRQGKRKFRVVKSGRIARKGREFLWNDPELRTPRLAQALMSFWKLL